MTPVFTDHVIHLKAEGAYAVLARAQELERQGREILHPELGQLDFFTPEHIKEKGIQALRENRTRYTPPSGIHHFRELIAEAAGRVLCLPQYQVVWDFVEGDSAAIA